MVPAEASAAITSLACCLRRRQLLGQDSATAGASAGRARHAHVLLLQLLHLACLPASVNVVSGMTSGCSPDRSDGDSREWP